LHNVTRVDNDSIIFDPFERNTLSAKEVERRLIDLYNAPRTYADLENGGGIESFQLSSIPIMRQRVGEICLKNHD